MKKKYHLYLILFYTLSNFAQQKLEIFFDFNKSDINDVANQKLNSWLEYNKDIEIQKIYGFCDSKGTNFYNDTLSQKRVASIYKFLKEKNLNIKANFETKAYGEDFQQSKVQSENRKVIIVFDKLKIPEPKTPEAIAIEELSKKIKSSKSGDIIKLKNLYFYNNSPKLLPKSEPILYELLCVMNDNPKLKIEIQGHICCQTIAGQYDVSTSRARTVYVYLLQKKIDRKRLSFKGYGNTKPIHPIPEKTEEQAEENRRVEILIVEN